MRRLTISEPATRVATERGMLGTLTVIPPDEVATTGIARVKTQTTARCRTLRVPYVRSNWRSFWTYVRHTWIDSFPPDVWNEHGMSNRIVARTNNTLERFNRELNVAFATAHPNMATFVSTIEELSRRYVTALEADDASDDVSENASDVDDGSADDHTALRPGSASSNGVTE
jgi:hypothetical protein